MDEPHISTDYSFTSRYTDVLGSKMHYVEQGQGEPILFLHGNPTWSYLWRNVVPHVSPHGRCIAPDLIGMGRSDKPDLDYRFFDHARYLDGFIEALGLKNVTLVLHDWGSGLGFHYARRHPENVRGIAFMEAIYRPMEWSDFPGRFRLGFKLFRAPGTGWLMLSALNLFVRKILPASVVRTLSAEEMRRYTEPFSTVASRRPVRQWPCEIPIGGKPADMHEVVSQYSEWLTQTELPKLLLYAHPGAILTADGVQWCEEHLPNLQTVDIGKGLHFVQEDNPHAIGDAVARWLRETVFSG